MAVSINVSDSKTLSVMMVATAGALWGVIGLFSRALTDAGLTSLQITLTRSFITAVGVIVILAFYDRKLMKIDPKDIWMFIGTGVCSIVLFNVLYFETAELVSLSITAVLLYTAPCFVMVFSIFLFREKVTSQKMLALIMAFGGCVLTAGLIGGSAEFSVKGFLMGLGSGFGYSLYTIFGKYALRKYHSFTVTMYTFLFASVALIPFCSPWHIVETAMEVDGSALYMLGLGLVITLLPYFLYTKGLGGLDAGVASVIAFIEPMVATLAGFVVYHETLSVSEVFGVLLILTSIVLLNINFKRKYGPGHPAESA